MSGTNKSAGDSSGFRMILYPDDAQKFLKWGTLGFVGLGLYQLFMTVAKRNINPSVEFKDPVESMNCDPIIRDSFVHIQSYRKLNPWLFKSALQNADKLLFLEDALLSQKAFPVRNDKVSAWTYFRLSVNRLNQFQYLVRERMGNEHGLAVNIFVRKVYDQLQKHVLNVFHLCSEFKPENLIARAPFEVERALKAFESGKPIEDPEVKWKKFQDKMARRQVRKERKRAERQLRREREEKQAFLRQEQEDEEHQQGHRRSRSRRSRRSRRSHRSRHSRHSETAGVESREAVSLTPAPAPVPAPAPSSEAVVNKEASPSPSP